MRIPYFQVNAFTRHPQGGNPAGVCLLESWLPDDSLQAIAASHLLSETAFVVPGQPRLRWFTPTTEVDLCGHATLATAHALFRHAGVALQEIRFTTRSGPLTVRRNGAEMVMDFPAAQAKSTDAPPGLAKALGAAPVEVFNGPSLLVLLADAAAVRGLAPDIQALTGMHEHAVIVTAPGDDAAFVSRFFAPRVGIAEDPVTGSAHCMLAPWWARRLGQSRLHARQLSARGGEMTCEVRGDRVLLSGQAVTFIEGHIHWTGT